MPLPFSLTIRSIEKDHPKMNKTNPALISDEKGFRSLPLTSIIGIVAEKQIKIYSEPNR
jgi:hypothetical protein